MQREFETGRLLLRPCRAEDERRVHALWTDERVRHFLFDGRAVSREETSAFIGESLSCFESRGCGLWLVFERGSGRLAGFAGFLCADAGPPNLIYGIRPDFWGRGYATEAAEAALTYAVGRLGLASVKADVDEPNAASVRVLEKLGMRRAGRAVVEGRPLLYFELPPAGGAR